MSASEKLHNNSIHISLTEPAVFIRSNDRIRRPNSPGWVDSPQQRPSMLRGLLTVHFVKPTRVTSIDVDLTAKTRTAWPEGLGARRVEVTEEHKVFSQSIVFFRAGPAVRRNASVGPGVSIPHEEDIEWRHPRPQLSIQTSQIPPPPSRSDHASIPTSVGRSSPVNLQHSPPYADIPTPPYTPDIPTSERPVLSRTSSSTRSAHALEDYRNALVADLRSSSASQIQNPPSASASLYRSVEPSRSLSRRPSIEDVPENDLPQFHPHTPPLPPPSSDTPHSVNNWRHAQSQQHSPTSPERRGRRHHRFSLASVFFDAVRSHSPQHTDHLAGAHRSEHSTAGRSPSRERSIEMAKHAEARSTLGRLGEILKLETDHDHHNHNSKTAEHNAESCDKWKVFKKGTYTFPISFTIPGDSPPTMECPFGAVTWRLKAAVHRPGAFKAKLTSTREVTVVAYPAEDNTEESENIIVERQWDDQLQYLITVSGKSFHIGGTIPVSFTLLPLGKMKVHRISILLEERIDYYTMMKRIAKTDPITRSLLLSLKGDGVTPILPLSSDDVEAFDKSPFSLMDSQNASTSKSEFVASLMGPGPWCFHHELQLNADCEQMHFSNTNRKSNMVVSHTLKIVMRVERGDDLCVDNKGKRKMFDIVVQAPVHILSCRCNPDWMALPRYTECFQQRASIASETCPCKDAPTGGDDGNSLLSSSLRRRRMRRSESFSSASTAETTAVHPGTSLRLQETLFEQNSRFERLVSGQETEAGEFPPSYESISRAASSSGARAIYA